MGDAEKPRLRLELAHVLFLDPVGYSKLTTTEQSARIQLLREIVSHTEQVRSAEAAGALLRVPTGDGGALVFRSLEAPVLCAIEIATSLRSHPELPVRMGIHSGPVNAVTDLNEQANIAGAGINLAQRVMDCGDAGHILISKHAAEDLEHHDEWRPCLHDLGEVEIKHGERLQVVNFYTNAVGNCALPAKVQLARQASRPRRRGSQLVPGAMAALLLLLAGGSYLWFRPDSAAIANADKSLAVLPFANTSSDPSNEYFSDGLSEELISALSRLKSLKVIGRTSSFQFKNTREDSKTIGGKLGVFFLLEGSVRKSADRVRIAVELIKSADGASVWSQSYDKELKDIFSVQSDIAGAVAKELKLTLFGQETPKLATGATPSNDNMDAYTARLKGDYYSARHTAEDSREAIRYYEKAVALDPHYALAYADLSITASNLVYNFGNITSKDGQEIAARARVAADTALRLDPNLSEAHLAKATFLRIIDLNYAAAEGESRRALELAPRSTGALLNLALLAAFTGHFDEALRLTEQEIALDPLRRGTQMNHAGYLAAVGRLAEAEDILRRAAASSPGSSQTHSNLARVQIARGETAAAIESAKAEPDPFFRTYALALAYYAHGDRAESDAELKKLIDSDSEDAGSQIASVYALRGEPDKMFSWLEHAWLTHDPGVSELMLDPFLRRYKDDPRFIAFAQKIGVMPRTGNGE